VWTSILTAGTTVARAQAPADEARKFTAAIAVVPTMPSTMPAVGVASGARRAGERMVGEVRVGCWNREDGKPDKVRVTLTGDRVLRWRHGPDGQPNMTADEFHECDAAMRSEPRVIEALARRGVTEMDRVLIEAWAGRPLPGGDHLYPPNPGLVDRIWPATFNVDGAGRAGAAGDGLLLSRTHPRPAAARPAPTRPWPRIKTGRSA